MSCSSALVERSYAAHFSEHNVLVHCSRIALFSCCALCELVQLLLVSDSSVQMTYQGHSSEGHLLCCSMRLSQRTQNGSLFKSFLWPCRAVKNCLSGEIPAEHEPAMAMIINVARDVALTAIDKLSRYSRHMGACTCPDTNLSMSLFTVSWLLRAPSFASC